MQSILTWTTHVDYNILNEVTFQPIKPCWPICYCSIYVLALTYLRMKHSSLKMKKFFTTTSSTFFHVFLTIALVSQTQTLGTKADSRSKKFIPLFIFGDSFLDAGNNNYINTTTYDQANFLPYGETYFKFPTGRFSDGRLISDFIGKILQIIFWIIESYNKIL